MTALPVEYERGDCSACAGHLEGHRCAALPRDDRAAAYHLCVLCEREPDRHGPAVRRMTRELAELARPDRPPPFVSPFLSRRTKPIRVGLTMPDFAVGGVASVTRLLAAAIGGSPDMELVGLAAWHAHHDSPIVFGYFPGVPTAHGRDGVRALAEACDVLVCSGAPDEGDWSDGLPCRRILVSHGACDFTRSRVRWADRADGLVAVSRYAAAASFPPRERARAVVIPNPPMATVPRRGRAQVRAEWGVPADAKVLGYVGRMSDEKRPWALLDALPHLPPGWMVALVGPYPERAVPWIESREVLDRVALPGPTDDPAGALLACDLVALTSETEGWAVVSSEALALGVPMLSTPVGAAADHPELFRLLPEDVDGRAVAAAVLEDDRDAVGTRKRALDGQAFARDHLNVRAFNFRWLDAIRRAAPAPVVREAPARPQEPALPSKARMAVSAARAAGRAVSAAVAGRPVLASSDLRDRRLAVCMGGAGLPREQTLHGHCDHFRPSDGRCGSWPDDGTAKAGCGCFLQLASRVATKDCPLSRWPKE